jgi:hypothetical protein
MKKSIQAILMFLLVFTGCTIIDNVDENGILWEYYTPSPIARGVETMPTENLLLFADEGNTLYAIDAGSGLLRWKIAPPLTLTTILPIDSTLYVIGYSNTGLQGSVIMSIDTLNGSLSKVESFPFKPLPNASLKTANGFLVYSSSQVAFLSNTGKVGLVVSPANNILAIEEWSSSYYIVSRESDNSTKLSKYDSSFSFQGSTTYADNPTGRLLFWNTRLYVGTDNKLLTSDSSPSLSVFKNFPVKAAMAKSVSYLYVPSAATANGSVRAYDTTGNEAWYALTYAAISYAPLMYNSSYNVVFALDDNGNLAVYDAQTGAALFTRYIASIQKPNLKLPMDLYQNYIFIPFSSPSKLVCFSLRYAASSR